MAMPSLAAIWWRCTVGESCSTSLRAVVASTSRARGSRILAATVAERPASLRDVGRLSARAEIPDRAGTKRANQTARSEPDACGMTALAGSSHDHRRRAVRGAGWLARPPAGAFAAVMATGIISVAAHDQQAQAHALSALSGLLAWLAAGAYVLLVILNAAGLVHCAERRRRDLAAPPASFHSLTFPAASGVLAIRMLLADRRGMATVLGLVAVAGWLGLGSVAAASLARRPPGRLPRVAHGSWLLAAVATQSLAVLTATAAQPGRDASPSAVPGGAWALLLLAAALGWWLAGMVLYGLLAASIWPRLLAALRGSPWAWFGADDWIVMGGLAIAALAATQITLAARAAPAANTVLGGLGPGASAVAMTAWVVASGWILPLAILQLRCITRAPLR